MPTVNGVVHTLGTLLEDGGYKAALKEGDLGSLFARLLSVGGDPLENNTKIRSYETINRDAGEEPPSFLGDFCSVLILPPPSTTRVRYVSFSYFRSGSRNRCSETVRVHFSRRYFPTVHSRSIYRDKT